MRTRVFYDKPKEACYGCQACSEICPVKAISMLPDKEGFLFPKIDTSKCIECNQCEKSCPTQHDVTQSLYHPVSETVDAAWNNDLAVRLESTSGGFFFTIASRWIDGGGVVYGADFDDDLYVRHVRVDNIVALKRLCGSKYVQSDTSGSFIAAKKDLQSGLKVLFSGTPCQIAGLRAYLKKGYENLLTIDLVCHGVPSPAVFNLHKKYLENKNNEKLIDYKFRKKKKTGWRAYIEYVFKNKCEYHKLGDDFYARCFYKSIINRCSCSTCEFSKSSRVGDITLSDFWGAEDACKPLMKIRKYGFNMVMRNTMKGEKFYQMVLPDISNISLPVKVAMEGDIRLRHPEKASDKRNYFFSALNQFGYDWMVDNWGARPSIISRIVPTWVKNLIYEIKARL